MTEAYLVVLNEVGKKQLIAVEGKLKANATDTPLWINGKGTNQYLIDCYHHFGWLPPRRHHPML